MCFELILHVIDSWELIGLSIESRLKQENLLTQSGSCVITSAMESVMSDDELEDYIKVIQSID